MTTDFSSRAAEVLNTLNENLGIVGFYASFAGPEVALVVLGFMGILSIVSEVIQYENAKTELDKLGTELDQLGANVSSLNNVLSEKIASSNKITESISNLVKGLTGE